MEENKVKKLIEENYFFIRRSNISRFIGGFAASVFVILGLSISSIILTMRDSSVKKMVQRIEELENRADTLVDDIFTEYKRLDSIDMLNVPIGTILSFGGDQEFFTKSDKWLPCDGRNLNRVDYHELFSTIKVYWGKGDGISTFSIPNLSGQFLRGIDSQGLIDRDHNNRVDTDGDIVGPIVGSLETHSTFIPRTVRTVKTYKITQADRAWGPRDGVGKNSISFPDEGWTGLIGTGDGSHAENGIKFHQQQNNYNIDFSENSHLETRPSNVYVFFMIKVK